MSGMTGYLTQGGVDLSYIFQSGTSAIITGFLLQNGDDIGKIFAIYSTNLASNTGLIGINNTDICTLFNAIPLLFSPLSISGCCLWMDANDSTKISLTNTPYYWTDKSTNAYSFTPGSSSTPSSNPSIDSTLQNGKQTMKFSGTNLNYFQGPATFTIGTNSYALFAVFKFNTTANGGIYNKSLYGATTNRIFMLRDNGYLNYGFVHTNTGFVTNITYTGGTTYHVMSLVINRKTQVSGQYVDESFMDGTSFSSYKYNAQDTTDYPATSNIQLIGAYNSSGTGIQGGYYLNGNIAEILSYKNPFDMSKHTRQQIEGYLAWKWGLQSNLPVGHEYKPAGP
jgi:hypothetical protein